MVEAARREQQTPLTPGKTVPAIKLDTPRPLPYAEPKATNDNLDGVAERPVREVTSQRRSPFRFIAMVLVLPLYLAGIVLSLGLIGLFLKNLFGF